MPSLGTGAQQRTDAGEKAVASRRARRELFEQINAGRVTIAAVLARAETDPVVARTEVRRLVEAFPGCGPGDRGQALTRAGVTGGRRVGSLGPWQREALIRALS